MKNKKYLYCLLLSILFIFPYLINDKLAIEHDTFFHLSRIEGYSNAIKNLDFLPKIYFNKNFGFGYASPTFYSDIFLLFPAILYLLSFNLAFIYKITIFIVTYLSALTMFNLVRKIDKSRFSPYIAAFVYLFANYRIADTYIRGALGELMAMIFLPLILEAVYEITQDKNSYKKLGFSFAGLLLSHNISFILAIITLGVFLIIYFNEHFVKNIFKAGILGFLLSLFYIVPLLEGLLKNTMYVNLYSNYNLQNSSLSLYNLINNTTTFGLGTKNAQTFMSINLGWFLLITPLLSLKNKSTFVLTSTIVGYLFVLFTIDTPLVRLIQPLSFIQFAWRLNIIALPLLSVAGSIGIARLLNKKIFAVLLIILSLSGILHLLPTIHRPLTINAATTYDDMISGKIIDPYYSAFYNRIELAGADYLPVNSPDFKEVNRCILENMTSNCDFTRSYNKLVFYAPKNSYIVLPVSYYYGYNIYKDNKKIKPFPSSNKLVSFTTIEEGEYILKYDKSILTIGSEIISLLTLLICIYLFFYSFFKRKRFKAKIF